MIQTILPCVHASHFRMGEPNNYVSGVSEMSFFIFYELQEVFSLGIHLGCLFACAVPVVLSG